VKLLRIDVQNFRGVPDGTYELGHGDAPHDVVVVTGRPSSGKTSLLEAIVAAKEAAGPYGSPPDAKWCLRSGAMQGRVVTTWVLTEAEAELAAQTSPVCTTSWDFGEGSARVEGDSRVRQLLATHAPGPASGKFEYFPATRRLFGEAWRPLPPPSKSADLFFRLARAPEKYACIRRMFVDLALADGIRTAGALALRGLAIQGSQSDSLAPFKKALGTLAPDLRLVSVEPRERSACILFQRRDGVQVELENLSDSEQQLVVFAATFVQQSLDNSVVLIDTPEANIHPYEHVRLLQGLIGLGRGNQLIVATTSEAILRHASPRQVLDLSNRRTSRCAA